MTRPDPIPCPAPSRPLRGRRNGDPIIVDSFAGGGGASTGIEMALGRSPDIAINHSADALAMHAVNHPETLHLDSNIWDVSPREVCGGRHVGLFWASPDCKHFSKAKGGKPMDRNIRDLAWVVVRWAEEVGPDVIILENVEEFRTWGPLYDDGKPIAELRGQTFDDWTRRLKSAGYKVQWRELRACDYGTPTIRKRFFMIARRDGKPIVWPKRTHGDPKKPADAKLIEAGRLKPWRTAAEIIDWSLPCPSIFDSSAEIMAQYGVRAVRPLADATMRRIARGVVRYVLEAKRPFIVPVYLPRSQPPASPSSERGPHGDPATTERECATADRGAEKTVIVPSLVGCGGRAGQSAPRGGDEPLGTLTAKPDGCVVAAHLSRFTQNGVGSAADEPVDTVMAGAAKFGVVAAHLTKFQSNSTGSDLNEPAPTVTANSFIKRPGGAAPIGVVAATMVQAGYGEREGQAPRALDIERPIGTQVAGGGKHAVVAAFLAQHNTDRIGVNPGRPVSEPIATVTATGAQQSVVAAGLLPHPQPSASPPSGWGPDGDPATTERDSATADRGADRSALIAPFLATYYGNGIGQEADGPLRTDTTKDRFGLVTVEIDGQTWAIADIGMRMLTPRERFRAQGFPDSYIIDRRPDGSPISATVQGSCCGNSVCPPLAQALVAANCADLAVEREAAE